MACGKSSKPEICISSQFNRAGQKCKLHANFRPENMVKEASVPEGPMGLTVTGLLPDIIELY